MSSIKTRDGTNSRSGRPIIGEASFRANGYEIRITLAGKRTTIRLPALGRTETPDATARAERYRDAVATFAREGRTLPRAALEPIARSIASLPETRLDAAREAFQIMLAAGRPAGELAAILSGIIAAPNDDAARAAVKLSKLAADGRASLPADERLSYDWIPPGLAPERAALLAPSSGTLPGTFGHLAELFLSGRLADAFPGRIHKRANYDSDRSGLRHVLPALANVPCRGLTLDHGEQALSAIPERLGPKYVQSIASNIRHLLNLAVYPLRWTETNPLPAKWVPRSDVKLERQILMPAEEHTFLACTTIPLFMRVFVAWQSRQGTRYIDAARLTVSSITFQGERATVRLAKTKDNDPRSWALDPDDTMMIRTWLEWRKKQGEKLDPSSPLFPGQSGGVIEPSYLALRIRMGLWEAGVSRAALFTRSQHSWPHEEHDLRALFCTYSLAKGRPASWVSDRTGHSLASMETYRRPARRWSEVELGDLAPSIRAIPELAALAGLEPLPPTPLPAQPGDLTVRPDTAKLPHERVSAQVSAHGRDRRGQERAKKSAEFSGKVESFAPALTPCISSIRSQKKFVW
ncbi:MAG: site-specific integrase [Polyangiaceae bacterium]|nr:site-specific integrase [Polyangiaceae bacterium]